VTVLDQLHEVTEERAAAPVTADPPAASPAPSVARVLALQRSAGNAAVSALLNRRPLARDLDPGAPAAAEGATDPAASPIAGLAAKAGSAAGLRALLAADPGLKAQIAAWFAAGNEDAALNAMLAEAFAPVAVAEPAKGGDKNPAGTVPTPPPISNEKKLDKGTMKWTLKADSQSSARCDVDFKADETKVEAKAISFGQTVVNQLGEKNFYAGATPADPEKNKSTYTPFEEAATKKRMDHMPDTENDPFYGAEWDQTQKKWVKESDDYVPGSSQKGVGSTSAKMFDIPGAAVAREGLGDASKQFETVPMILETRQPLGSLSWGFKIKDEANAPIELTGGKLEDCVDTPSADWGATMDQFYVGKYAEILDDFDVAKSDLKPDHKTKLDGIVTKMKANTTLNAQFGGAADLTGDQKFNEELSLKRATNARDYVVGKGIDGGRTEIQSYGSDWARVEAEAGKSEGKNRRVQIWLH
jgi:outer membrane protein OmpA-like peptidoglycan-associated protein